MLLEAAMAELPCGDIRVGSHTSTTTMTLFQDDQDFVSKLLRKDASNLGTSHRLAFKSSTTMQVAGGAVPYQCKEIDPGKPKNVIAKDKEEYKPPISLPPIRIPSAFNHGPSSSVAQSPSLSNKLMIKNAKRPESSTNNSPHRSPSSNISSPRERRSMLSSCYVPLESPLTTPGTSESSFNGEEFTPSRLSNTLVGRSPMLYSPYTPSQYYFSPLSNTSSHNFGVGTSPRSSIQSDASHASIEPTIQNHVHGSFAHGPSSTLSNPHDSHGVSGNSPRSNASCSDAEDPLQDNGGTNGGDSLSFASPEMEILDEGPASNLYNASRGGRSTILDFINRGGPMMHRSFSTSRVTFAEDLRRKPVLKKFYSAQYSGEAQPKRGPMQDPTLSALDELFPLTRPNALKQAMNVAHNQHAGENAPHVGMNASVGSLKAVVGDDKNIANNMTIMSPLERPAQEVVMQGGDEDAGFAYSPVASAFVFSPRRASQNSYFMRSASSATRVQSNLASTSIHTNVKEGPSQKSSFSSEEVGEGVEVGLEGTPLSTRASWGSPKISSVLLRFAEAQERLYNSAPASPHHLPSAPTSCLPMCSFLGRKFLCQSKFAVARQLQE